MSKILLIRCSISSKTPRGSISGHALDLFKKEYIEKYPQDTIIEKDLNKLDYLQLCLNENNLSTWFDQNSKDLINELKSIDKLVIATSMINFNYPSLLKNYIDKICLAGETFSYKYDNGKGGSIGLLKNLKVGLITSQGSSIEYYPFSAIPSNLEGTFRFLGSNVVESVILDGSKIPSQSSKTKEEFVDQFKDKISNLIKALN
ncbi:MAG: FMN-dependent NADH-azoreductase [Mycoplasmoidaceae bacterium]